MRILVTGSAGFIGATLTRKLLEHGEPVWGLDNHNDYYDPALKEARLARLLTYPNYTHIRADLAAPDVITDAFARYRPQRVVHLAAQAGVRYSLKHPDSYIQSNLVGFGKVLEGCRQYDVEHLVYASSSSVYGGHQCLPFTTEDAVGHPLSLYAATKQANELMAHSYSHLYRLPTTGLRLFTVYGPWGRPDMAPMLFADRIWHGQPIDVFNAGQHRRDFTYIDDIVEGIRQILDHPAQADPCYDTKAPRPDSSDAPWRIYNIGTGQSIALLHFIELLEKYLGRSVEKRMQPMQDGDIQDTCADVATLRRDLDYAPTTHIEDGVAHFASWYRDYIRGTKATT